MTLRSNWKNWCLNLKLCPCKQGLYIFKNCPFLCNYALSQQATITFSFSTVPNLWICRCRTSDSWFPHASTPVLHMSRMTSSPSRYMLNCTNPATLSVRSKVGLLKTRESKSEKSFRWFGRSEGKSWKRSNLVSSNVEKIRWGMKMVRKSIPIHLQERMKTKQSKMTRMEQFTIELIALK